MPMVAEAKEGPVGPLRFRTSKPGSLRMRSLATKLKWPRIPRAFESKEEAVLDFYRAQIEAAKSIQRQTLPTLPPTREWP